MTWFTNQREKGITLINLIKTNALSIFELLEPEEKIQCIAIQIKLHEYP